jgi:RHS repeat-associated protein
MAFTYDAVGNRLTGPAYPKAGTFLQNYAYDFENRVVSVTRQVTGNPNADTVTFKYDPFGRRIEKNVSTYESGLSTTYKYTYVYDNEDIILEVLERTQSGNTTTTTTAYTHGPGIDEPLSLARDGQKYYYHADGLGSITSMTDSTQAVVNRYSYDSFGVVKRAETVCNDFTYTGREYDYETGLYYYRARYYDPEAGRFVNKDPIGFEGGDVNLYGYVDSVGKPLTETNLYLYTANSPVNRIDPLGLDWLDDLADFSAGMGDTLTFGGTKLIREQWNEAYGWGEDAANQCADFYTAGKWSGIGVGFGLSGAGIARAAGWTSKISIHGAHHPFGSLGKLSHIQITIWKIGLRGSGRNFRIPLPWR